MDISDQFPNFFALHYVSVFYTDFFFTINGHLRSKEINTRVITRVPTYDKDISKTHVYKKIQLLEH